jgi:hypothetical protein
MQRLLLPARRPAAAPVLALAMLVLIAAVAACNAAPEAVPCAAGRDCCAVHGGDGDCNLLLVVAGRCTAEVERADCQDTCERTLCPGLAISETGAAMAPEWTRGVPRSEVGAVIEEHAAALTSFYRDPSALCDCPVRR